MEVCGFNSWLLKLLTEYGCQQTVLVQPEKRNRHKTDRRDANTLGELLWTSRHRLLAGKNIQNVRQVVPPCQRDGEDRQLTAVRQRLSQQLTRTINRVHHLLLKHNLQQECPTKMLKTKTAVKWLKTLPLEVIDRLELDHLLAEWERLGKQIEELERRSPNATWRTPTRGSLLRSPAPELAAAWHWPAGSARSSVSRSEEAWPSIGA